MKKKTNTHENNSSLDILVTLSLNITPPIRDHNNLVQANPLLEILGSSTRAKHLMLLDSQSFHRIYLPPYPPTNTPLSTPSFSTPSLRPFWQKRASTANRYGLCTETKP